MSGRTVNQAWDWWPWGQQMNWTKSTLMWVMYEGDHLAYEIPVLSNGELFIYKKDLIE
jgi:hypothetical protein